MDFNNLTPDEIRGIFSSFEKYLSRFGRKFVKYADLGCKTVRFIGFDDRYLSHMEKQLTYVLRDNCEKYDATLVLCKL